MNLSKPVPNLHPRINEQDYKIAIIGDAPGENEELQAKPFVGMSGRLLDGVLSQFGILRDACLAGHVCQVRPPANNLAHFAWTSDEIQSGVTQLLADLATFKPNLVLCLGSAALHLMKTGNAPVAQKGKLYKAFTYPHSIDDWRGSLFMSPYGYKCLATYHPSTVLRMYEHIFPFKLDLKRARLEGKTPTLDLPYRRLDNEIVFDSIIEKLREIRRCRTKIALDIEGYVYNMTCLSIATSTDYAFIIPFTNSFYPTVESEMLMWQELALTLGDPDVPKVLQNAMYDLFVLQHGYKLPVRGLVDDTMLKHWELVCEAPKALDFQASVYTRQPYWKDGRGSQDKLALYEYCCIDSAVTYEINETLNNQLQGTSKDHYELNVQLLEPLLYMESKGILYDKEKAIARHNSLMSQAYRLTWALNEIAGIYQPTSREEWFSICRDKFCFVRSIASVKSIDAIQPNSKMEFLHEVPRAVEILKGTAPLTMTEIGELSMLTELALNVESSDQIGDFLYRQLGLEIQYKKEKGKLTDKETTDVLALLTCYKKSNDKTLKLILTIRALRTRADVLKAQTDPDGSIRCGYNLVGTETGRLSCYESPTGSGFNLQTVTKKDRDLFKPDPGWWLFQCDLSGADGWTVAAHCKQAGDSTMFDDYMFGLKPAKIIAAMYQQGQAVLYMSQAELKEIGKSVDSEGWLYFACKRVQHGCYTGDHEVLTPNGWVPFNKLDPRMEVMVHDPANNTAWFEQPSDYTHFTYSGPLHRARGTAIDFAVTDDHKILFYTNNKAKYEPAYMFSQRKACKLQVTSLKTKGYIEPLARLIAAYQSDGCLTDRNYVTWHLSKERKVARLKELLLKNNIQYTQCRNADDTYHFCVTNQADVKRINRYTKTANASMLEWDGLSLGDYIEEYPHWDGTFGATGSTSVFSANREHIDWITTFANLCHKGYTWQTPTISGFGSKIYRTQLNNRKQASKDNLDSYVITQETDIPVYCVTVSTGFLLVRRNGKIHVSGNSNYGMKGKTMSDVILKDSYKLFGEPIYVDPKTCEALQQLYFRRYPGVLAWHERVKRQIKQYGYLISANGHKRIFFGRRDDYDTFKQACADEPQNNTTHATNYAMYRLWTDNENRTYVDSNLQLPSTQMANNGQLLRRCTLRIQPLHQVHDALIGQFRQEDSAWAVGKIKSYFNNPLIIAGQAITIPFEGHWGSSWGQLGTKYGGGSI